MTSKTWLVAWIGRTDHDAARGVGGVELGPIATALAESRRFDHIYLLTNYPFAQSQAYCEWLQDKLGYREDAVDLFEIALRSPIDYASIYEEVSKNLKAAGLPREDVALTFHLSPGTPAMAAIWIILAKTRFPATLIQTSRERGLERVDFRFDLTSDFLPEFLQRSGERIDRLTAGPKDPGAPFDKILHASPSMGEQIALARRIAVYDVPVLVLGETGTGKELFAEAIHATSARKSRPYLAVNCGAISPELANSELFGHKAGAFTGARSERKGHFREADGGTLFLDEIGELPLDAQVRLLRVLQAGEVTPLGQSSPVKVDTRVIAATHRDLSADVASGRFREDLFHRLAVGILRLPPLRERGADIELLLDAFLARINADAKGRPEAQEKALTPEARALLLSHSWPGNVRELYHTLVRASIWSPGPRIDAADAAAAILQPAQGRPSVLDRPLTPGFSLQDVLDEVSRSYITRALEQARGVKTAAARLVGLSSFQTLDNRMTQLGMTPFSKRTSK
ncbi:sigma-54-dependent Fis family transcriptional regulator [Pseudacidovorax sp. RU35E]|jgi:DNA-binding NtrC family response regulator|uniref:sigma-54 interaction domain-containing protein n=1 Tax=Pseudacidovorax sp. RU35E TaxID=1907403 RepID=UPI000953AC32|nr:sigma-54 dependent transcriptional regulator [Pseudacidovorax sp. RU35E]SIR51407.1 regulatory protein, Fis family [Pseudacidovorax sp. RU35E]